MKKKKKKSKLQYAVEHLSKAIKNDPSYRISWEANIAVSFQDEVYRFKKKNNKNTLSQKDIHQISNDAAKNFLDLLIK